jgi:phosphohistidine phosphatase SixA
VEFEFRRHSIKDGPHASMIGPAGCALAREVGRAQLRGKGFGAFFASTYWRTHQTLAAFAEGAGDFILKRAPDAAPIYLLSPEIKALWGICAAAERRGEDMVQAAIAHDAGLVRSASIQLACMFDAWADTFPADARTLVVGHSPGMEFLAMGIAGVVMPGLRECQGFRISVDAGRHSVDLRSPDLDPSGIRRSLFP